MTSFHAYLLRKIYNKVQKLGDRLAKIKPHIDWNAFTPIIQSIYPNNTPMGGRPNVDLVVMMKLLVLIKFPERVVDKIHSHPEANQMVIGLSGETEMPDGTIATLTPTSVFYFDKGEKHGASRITKECITLFFWDGPPRPEIEE